jgi:sugar O-acyltransferase (sialic acid O-acetyltransferase NeuD family)
MENPVLILGASGIGVVALEIFQSNKVVVYGFLDDNASLHGTEINSVSVLGNTEDENFLKLLGKKCEVFVASDDNKYRKNIVEYLVEERKVMPVNAIHKKAYISPTASFGHGNLVNAGVTVNTVAKISNHCILHTGCVLDYGVQVGDFVQVGAGSVINNGVTIADNVFIGSGVTVVAGISIGKGARIGAGSVVIENVKPNATVFGNPAQVVGK